MQIDYVTTIAEIINFLVLVGLLRIFLYRPIVQAMEAREKKVAGRLEEARRSREQAEAEAGAYRRQQQELETQRAGLLADAGVQAESRRDEMLKDARAEAEANRQAWQQVLLREQESFLSSLRLRAGQEVYAIARQVLQDLAGRDLESYIIDTFIERLRGLDESERAEMAGIVREGRQVNIDTSFDISPELRDKVTAAVRELVQRDVEPRFSTAADLIGGIELRVDGHKTSWTLSGYLQAMEEDLGRVFPAPEVDKI